MKVTRIEIKDFHQFKDFSIDLTYPVGHEKEGRPLDKVCFIGQSGTGKTTLLEILPWYIAMHPTKNVLESWKELIENFTLFSVLNDDVWIQINTVFVLGKKENGADIEYYDIARKKTSDEISIEINEWLDQQGSKPIYFPSNLNYEIDESKLSKDFSLNSIYDFSYDNVASVWTLITEQIQKYQEQELKIRQDISRTVEQSSNDLDIIKKALEKLEHWKKTEFNPIKDVADNCLNPILSNFKLQVKTELDIKSKDDIGFIKIEDFSGNGIPQGLWSTGTKQVVLSALPLYLLKPKNTIILFDEPEKSLYPDLQRLIVDNYSSLADNCQFFYATHSPIIASSFDPWEIVELKFNAEGKVYRELYYEGENHVDNYKYNPRLMRWDDILQRVFDMENDGSPERKIRLDELASLNVKFKKLTKNGEDKSEEATKILKRIQKLREELSYWD